MKWKILCPETETNQNRSTATSADWRSELTPWPPVPVKPNTVLVWNSEAKALCWSVPNSEIIISETFVLNY